MIASTVNLKYRFEKAPVARRPLSNAIERFGNLACNIVARFPSAVPDLSIGRAEKIADGFLDPGLLAPQPNFNLESSVRIRCVEDQNGPLVEYHYDKNGRISEVVLLSSMSEKYSWRDDGRLNSIAGRDSQLTRFSYHKDALPASVSYPDGAIFKYKFGSCKRLSEITYPDGKTLTFRRNEAGYIVNVLGDSGIFEYVLNNNGNLTDVKFVNDIGAWGFDPNDTQKKVRFQLVEKRSGASCDFLSAAGLWRYDINGTLQEMFIPSGERLVCRRPEQSQIVSWSSRGQVSYQLDKSGVLMGFLNAAGARTLFKRLNDCGTVVMVSAAGIGFLKYDRACRLSLDRNQNGEGTAYTYGSSGDLKTVSSKGQLATFGWKANHLTNIAFRDTFSGAVAIKNTKPTRLEIKVNSMTNLEAVNLFHGLLWNWQVLAKAQRLHDTIIGGQNGCNS